MLCNLSNVFENSIYNRLENFCQTSNFLPQKQFGFRIKRNTELTTLSLLDQLLPALKKVLYVSFLITLHALILRPARFHLTSWKDMTYVA